MPFYFVFIEVGAFAGPLRQRPVTTLQAQYEIAIFFFSDYDTETSVKQD
jgi:hypothetical protein